MPRLIFSLLFISIAFCNGLLEGGHRHEKRLVLITGCARSATTYISKLLELNGLAVVHEGLAEHGCASWTMAVDAATTPWGPGSRGLEFEHIFHQVRHPLETIASVYTTEPEESWEFIYKHIPEISPKDSHLVRCVKYWIYWNLKAEALAEWTYRIEDIEKELPVMSKKLGVPLDPNSIKFVSKITNHRGTHKKKLTWKDLKHELSRRLYDELQITALHYGYPIND